MSLCGSKQLDIMKLKHVYGNIYNTLSPCHLGDAQQAAEVRCAANSAVASVNTSLFGHATERSKVTNAHLEFNRLELEFACGGQPQQSKIILAIAHDQVRGRSTLATCFI